MADPFSIAASAAGIFSLGLTVSSGLVRCVQTMQGAPKELETVCNNLYALCGILEQIKELQRQQHSSVTPAPSTPSHNSVGASTSAPWAHANNTFPVTLPPSSVSGHGSTADLDKGSASLFDPTPSDPDPYDSGHEDGTPPTKTFRAWTTTATSESASLAALGLRCHIQAAHLPREELLAILGRPRGKEGGAGRGTAVSARLRAFNEPVRQMILRHAASLPGAGLVGVEGLGDEQGKVVQSVFGDVAVVAPVWVTAHDDADAERDEEVEREVRRRLERMGLGDEVENDMRRKAEEGEEKLERVKREKALRMERESLQKMAYMSKAEGKHIGLRAGSEVGGVERSYKEEKSKQIQEARLRLMEEDLAVRRKKQEVSADKLARLKGEVKLLERRLREAEMRRDMSRAVDIRRGALPDVRFRIQEVEAEMMQDGKVLLELEGRVLERKREGEKRKSEEKRSVQEIEELYKREKSPRPLSHHTSESIRRGGSARSSDADLQDSDPFEVTLDRNAAEAWRRI